jgi:hypothetical protein
MYTIFFISFLTTLALHVSGAICTHHQEHNCSVQCVISLEQVLVWETFTLKHGQLQKEIKNIVYICLDLNKHICRFWRESNHYSSAAQSVTS